jgi:predicted transcriptional regulator of viral defense system
MYSSIGKGTGESMDRKKSIINMAKKKGIISNKDVEKAGIPREYIYRLCDDDILRKLDRGLYMLRDSPISEQFNLLEVVKKIPHGVISLISALNYHQLTTQIPHEIWITIKRGSWNPDFEYPKINITFASEKVFHYGIQEHIIDQTKVKIYSPAKTVVDCLKFRNKVGLDIAIEALKEVLRKKSACVDELMEAAKVCRVTKIILPYLEALV